MSRNIEIEFKVPRFEPGSVEALNYLDEEGSWCSRMCLMGNKQRMLLS